ncbi:RNA polymerase sigma factor [Echinicola sp. 20G]|uniref:RNA polymerase sigma factor n=1 Tax=Echinicola sp. 20G TaxID=2781961 RepID=UPI001910EE4C|nr:sigma-70 family RNA polymerase sigma factor [Echinicola sp. 20G]
MDDIALWECFKQGNDKAFEFIYRCHAKSLYGYGHRFTKDTELIADVIQDVFVKVWDSRKNIVINKSISFYLIKAFRHLMIKKIKELNLSESLDEYNSQINFEYYMEEVLEKSKISQHNNSRTFLELEKLPSRQKEAIYLRFIEELPYENISEIMGVKIPYIYNLIFKGLKTLKENIVSTKTIKISVLLILNFLQ